MRFVYRSVIPALVLLISMAGASAETVKIAIGEWKPFISKELPHYGPHAKRVTQVLESAGYDIEYEFLPWKRAYEFTANGRYAATFSWFKTEKRLKEVQFPETPVEVRETAIFHHKDRFDSEPGLTSLEDIADADLSVIGVQGYWYMDKLKALDADLHAVPNAKLAWRLLKAGRADIYIEDTAVAKVDIVDDMGEESLSEFKQAGIVRRSPMYILFTKARGIGAELRDAWDANAAR